MASIILVTIDSLACGFFIYVLLKWTRETHRKQPPSRPPQKKSANITPINEVSDGQGTASAVPHNVTQTGFSR